MESMEIQYNQELPQSDASFEFVDVSDNSTEMEPALLEENVDNDCTFVWKRTPILLLLSEYEKRKQKFRSGSVKKKILWTEIKNEFDKRGYNLSSDVLDKKFRNMKSTFLKIRDNSKRLSKGDDVSWEYYRPFCKIFDGEMSPAGDFQKRITVMGENGVTIKLETLEKIDVTPTPVKQCEVKTNLDTSDACSCGTKEKRSVKRNFDAFCEEMLKIEEEKLQEARKLSETMQELVKIQQERNAIFAGSISLKKKRL